MEERNHKKDERKREGKSRSRFQTPVDDRNAVVFLEAGGRKREDIVNREEVGRRRGGTLSACGRRLPICGPCALGELGA